MRTIEECIKELKTSCIYITHSCEVKKINGKNYNFDNLIEIDWSDKDFVIFKKSDGIIRAFRRDQIEEIYIF